MGKIEKFLLDRKLVGHIIFGIQKGPKEKTEFFKARIKTRVVNAYRKSYLGQIRRYKNKSIVDYAIDADPDEIQRVRKSEIPNITSIIADPDNNKLDSESAKHTKFTEFHLQNKQLEKLIVFRQYDNIPFLRKSDLLSLTKDVLTFSNKDQMQVGRKIDCLLYGNEMLIFRKNGFEVIFGFKEVYLDHANQVFDHFRKVPFKIEGLDDIQKSCTDLRTLRRISNAFTIGRYKNWDIKKIETWSLNNKDVKMNVNVKANMVKFESSKEFTHFLNQDYNTDDFTGDKFLSFLKKRRPSST